MPKLETLVEDIYKLFDPNTHHEPNEENIEEFLGNMRDLLKVRLSERNRDASPLRFSNLGKPNRQIWYMANNYEGEELTAKTYFKFLYGDIIEQMLLFLCKEAGHEVTHPQAEVEVNGVKGHIDAVIDGVTVDVKSASPYGYKKFKDGTLFQEDPFGYLNQLGGYANVVTPDTGGAFLAFNKVDGDICLLPMGTSIIGDYEPEGRIAELKYICNTAIPPERCYDAEPDGKSGNMKLGVNCSYCPFKKECWPGLRTFIYSTGPRFLTKVEKVPDVYEVQK